MFHPQLGVSLSLVSIDLTDALVQNLARSHIATLELSPRPFDSDRQLALSRMQALLQTSSIRVATIHALFGPAYDLSSSDAHVRQSGLSAVASAIDLAVELGAPMVVVHASAEPIAPSERQDRLAQAHAALAEVEKWCQASGRQAAIELLPRTCLGNTVEELLALLQGLDKTACGVCLDTNHLMDRHQSLAQTVRQLGGRLLTLHLSDYDGVDEKHALPGQGILDWAAFMQALRDIDYAGPFNYECHLEGDTPEQRVAALERNFDWLSAL